MKVVFGCDPNATQFKLDLMEYVKSLGHEVADLGSDDPIYANTAMEVAKAVAAKEYDRGIIVCGTGIGVSIADLKQIINAFEWVEKFGGLCEFKDEYMSRIENNECVSGMDKAIELVEKCK